MKLSAEEIYILRTAADRAGMTCSNLVRRAALAEAHLILSGEFPRVRKSV